MQPKELITLTNAYNAVYAVKEEGEEEILSEEANQTLDAAEPYDIILLHLLDEGFASSVENAEKIISVMSDEWIQSIVEVTYGGDTSTPADKGMEVTNADKKGNTKAYQNYLKGDPRYRGAAHLKGV